MEPYCRLFAQLFKDQEKFITQPLFCLPGLLLTHSEGTKLRQQASGETITGPLLFLHWGHPSAQCSRNKGQGFIAGSTVWKETRSGIVWFSEIVGSHPCCFLPYDSYQAGLFASELKDRGLFSCFFSSLWLVHVFLLEHPSAFRAPVEVSSVTVGSRWDVIPVFPDALTGIAAREQHWGGWRAKSYTSSVTWPFLAPFQPNPANLCAALTAFVLSLHPSNQSGHPLVTDESSPYKHFYVLTCQTLNYCESKLTFFHCNIKQHHCTVMGLNNEGSWGSIAVVTVSAPLFWIVWPW